jgi:hypothetical protein
MLYVSLKSGSRVLSLPLIQNNIKGTTVRTLNPKLRSQNWKKVRELRGSTYTWKVSLILDLRSIQHYSPGM